MQKHTVPVCIYMRVFVFCGHVQCVSEEGGKERERVLESVLAQQSH